jgi:hypothetical protein
VVDTGVLVLLQMPEFGLADIHGDGVARCYPVLAVVERGGGLLWGR